MNKKIIALALAVLLLLCSTVVAYGLYSNTVEDSDFPWISGSGKITFLCNLGI